MADEPRTLKPYSVLGEGVDANAGLTDFSPTIQSALPEFIEPKPEELERIETTGLDVPVLPTPEEVAAADAASVDAIVASTKGKVPPA